MGKWTPTELDALAASTSDVGMDAYQKFSALTGYSRSFNAYEVKRRRVEGEQPGAIELAGPGQAAPKVTGIPEDYVGLTVAFWDLETTFSTEPIVLYGAIADVFGNVRQFKKGKDITEDAELVKAIADALAEYDVWVTWNGKLFDVPVLNARLRAAGLPPVQERLHIDAMYYATGGSMRLGRRSLQHVSEYFGVQNRKTPLSVAVWNKALAGSEEAYDLIAEHCDADVLVTRDVFAVLKTQIRNIHR